MEIEEKTYSLGWDENEEEQFLVICYNDRHEAEVGLWEGEFCFDKCKYSGLLDKTLLIERLKEAILFLEGSI